MTEANANSKYYRLFDYHADILHFLMLFTVMFINQSVCGSSIAPPTAQSDWLRVVTVSQSAIKADVIKQKQLQ